MILIAGMVILKYFMQDGYYFITQFQDTSIIDFKIISQYVSFDSNAICTGETPCYYVCLFLTFVGILPLRFTTSYLDSNQNRS